MTVIIGSEQGKDTRVLPALPGLQFPKRIAYSRAGVCIWWMYELSNEPLCSPRGARKLSNQRLGRRANGREGCSLAALTGAASLSGWNQPLSPASQRLAVPLGTPLPSLREALHPGTPAPKASDLRTPSFNSCSSSWTDTEEEGVRGRS